MVPGFLFCCGIIRLIKGFGPQTWDTFVYFLPTLTLERGQCKEIQPVHSEGDQPWDFFERNDAKAENPVLWPPHAKSWLIGKLWCWEGLGAGGEGDNRGWDGWMAWLTWWMWVWVNSRNWWWTSRPGMLWFMGSQRVRHNWATSLSLHINVKITTHTKTQDNEN